MGNRVYFYFVSYAHQTGFGSAEIKRISQITTYEDVFEIEKLIAEEYKFPKPIVTNFILLREEKGAK